MGSEERSFKEGRRSLLDDALAELSAVSGGRDEARGVPVLKGANTAARRRNALGRGLSALMSSASVSVELEERGAASEPARRESVVAERAITPVRHYEPREPVASDPDAEAPAVAAAADAQTPSGGLMYVDIERLRRNDAQPRQHFDEEELESLAKSIRDSGLLQPILVRKPEGELGPLGAFEIVAGERRFRAAKLAGLTKVPVILKQLSDRETLELGIIENVQRADLNPIEEASAYQRLIDDFNATQNEIAETVGKDRVSISNALRLLKLAPPVRELVSAGKLSAGHGRALLMFESPEEQQAVAERIISESLSVRAVERLGSEQKDPAERRPRRAKSPAAPKAPAVLELEERLRRALGTKVNLAIDNAGRGELRISFFSQDELESLLEIVGA